MRYEYFLYSLIQLAIVLVIIVTIFKAFQKAPLIFSHWYHLIENLQQSSQEFYTSVEGAIQQRQLPDISLSRIDHHQGGVFSPKREYLRVSRKELTFDICAAPFGSGFFISWWLGETIGPFLSLLMKIPLLGPAVLKIFRPLTYYRLDTTLMFQEMIRRSVLEVISEITKAHGLRALTESEQKPILREFFKR